MSLRRRSRSGPLASAAPVAAGSVAAGSVAAGSVAAGSGVGGCGLRGRRGRRLLVLTSAGSKQRARGAERDAERSRPLQEPAPVDAPLQVVVDELLDLFVPGAIAAPPSQPSGVSPLLLVRRVRSRPVSPRAGAGAAQSERIRRCAHGIKVTRVCPDAGAAPCRGHARLRAVRRGARHRLALRGRRARQHLARVPDPLLRGLVPQHDVRQPRHRQDRVPRAAALVDSRFRRGRRRADRGGLRAPGRSGRALDGGADRAAARPRPARAAPLRGGHGHGRPQHRVPRRLDAGGGAAASRGQDHRGHVRAHAQRGFPLSRLRHRETRRSGRRSSGA